MNKCLPVFIVGFLVVINGCLDQDRGGLEEVVMERSIVRSSYVLENSTLILEVDLNDIIEVYWINLTLHWADEIESVLYTNMPDTFHMKLIIDGEEIDEAWASGGSLSIRYRAGLEEMRNSTFNVSIACTEAGDHEPIINQVGLRPIKDEGNDFTLLVEVSFLSRNEDGGIILPEF